MNNECYERNDCMVPCTNGREKEANGEGLQIPLFNTAGLQIRPNEVDFTTPPIPLPDNRIDFSYPNRLLINNPWSTDRGLGQ